MPLVAHLLPSSCCPNENEKKVKVRFFFEMDPILKPQGELAYLLVEF